MSCRSMKPAVRSALLLLFAAAAPTAAITLSVVPAQPVESTPFILAIGLDGACPVPTSIVATPGVPGVVQVTLSDVCTAPAVPRLVEVPIGPLGEGQWLFRVELGGAQALRPFSVQRLPFRIDLDPSHPQAGSPFTMRFTGSGSCPGLRPVERDGNLLTFPFDDNCPILPPGRGPFLLEETLAPLPTGDYAVQVTNDFGGETAAALRFHVFGPFECIPSDTALCLQGGRFRVEAAWRTATAQGVGRARPETADSGSFWFFNPDNLELLVKVLDACRSDTPKLWVFAAGLTDVEVDLTVTDTATQTTRRYHNRRGAPFAPILDTAAFNCS